MSKKEEIFKTIILFLFFLFGCSNKYVSDGEEVFGRKVVASWEELNCRVIEQDEQGFSLGFQLRDIIVVGDSIKSGELYKRKSPEKGSDWPLLGGVIGICGCLGGIAYGTLDNPWDAYDEEKFDRGCLIAFTSCLAGFGMAFVELLNRRKDTEAIPYAVPYFVKGDTICVDSMLLSKQKIKISVEESDFEETYYTDKYGNIELKFKEILPESTEDDSGLNLIIQYYNLIDTVRVRRL